MVEDCSLKTDSRAPLLRTASTQLIEHEEIELVPAWSLCPTFYSLGYEKVLSAGYRNRNLNIKQATDPSIYNLFYLQNVLGQWWLQTYGIDQQNCLV